MWVARLQKKEWNDGGWWEDGCSACVRRTRGHPVKALFKDKQAFSAIPGQKDNPAQKEKTWAESHRRNKSISRDRFISSRGPPSEISPNHFIFSRGSPSAPTRILDGKSPSTK